MSNTVDSNKNAAVDYGVKTTTSGGTVQVEQEHIDRRDVLVKKAEVIANGK